MKNWKKIFLICLVTLLFQMNVNSQIKTTIYFLPGQGADHRLFYSLSIDTSFTLKFIDYKTPAKKASMTDFAKEIAKEIDTTENFILVGVSLGGMLCVELSELLNPEKKILISSAKNRKDFPFRYSFQKFIPLYEIIPASLLFSGAKFMQPLVEPDRDKHKETFKSMLDTKNPIYMKRTIRMIMRWNRVSNTKNIIHIHGLNDHTLPYNKIKNVDYKVEPGSHMMTLTQAKVISKILNKVLKE